MAGFTSNFFLKTKDSINIKEFLKQRPVALLLPYISRIMLEYSLDTKAIEIGHENTKQHSSLYYHKELISNTYFIMKIANQFIRNLSFTLPLFDWNRFSNTHRNPSAKWYRQTILSKE